MNNKQFITKLKELDACSDAIDFVKENKYTLKQSWKNCTRADWMLWLMCEMEFATRKVRIHIICDCAATALKYVTKGENRPRKAIDAARQYADNPTEDNLQFLNTAGDAARAAAWAAAGDAAWDAARAVEKKAQRRKLLAMVKGARK